MIFREIHSLASYFCGKCVCAKDLLWGNTFVGERALWEGIPGGKSFMRKGSFAEFVSEKFLRGVCKPEPGIPFPENLKFQISMSKKNECSNYE